MSKEEFLSKLYDSYEDWDIVGLHDSIIDKAFQLLTSKDLFITATPEELLTILLCADLTVDNLKSRINVE